MSSNNITFDPDSGVPYGANLSIYTGGDFKQTLNVKSLFKIPTSIDGEIGTVRDSRIWIKSNVITSHSGYLLLTWFLVAYNKV